MNELSRFKPLDHLPLSPGVCFICKGGVGPFIDTSLTVDFEGAIYICQGCIKEMFSQLGLESVINAEEVELKIADAANTGYEAGRLEVMRLFSEFVSVNSADRVRDLNDADSDGPDSNHVAPPVGTTENDTKPRQGNVEGSGITGLEELGSLSGSSSNGGSLFSFD